MRLPVVWWHSGASYLSRPVGAVSEHLLRWLRARTRCLWVGWWNSGASCWWKPVWVDGASAVINLRVVAIVVLTIRSKPSVIP